MSAAGARRIGEVRLEIHPDSAGNMARFVPGLPGGPPRVQRTSATTGCCAASSSAASSAAEINTAGLRLIGRPAFAERERIREARLRYRSREPTTMMAATEHLVRDLLTLSTAACIGIRERVADHDLIAL